MFVCVEFGEIAGSCCFGIKCKLIAVATHDWRSEIDWLDLQTQAPRLEMWVRRSNNPSDRFGLSTTWHSMCAILYVTFESTFVCRCFQYGVCRAVKVFEHCVRARSLCCCSHSP